MQKDFYLSRYSLIIKKLESKPTNYPDLEDYLLSSFEFKDAGVTSYSIRTLQRDIREISRLFNITIHNKKKGDNRYYIEDRPEAEVDEYNQKLLESFQISNALNQQPEFENFVFFESRKPTGLEYFYNLFYAIRNKREISFIHFKFKTECTTQRTVHPLALKESKGRWYLIGVDKNDTKIKAFGLDRISLLKVSDIQYRKKYRFNLREHFKNSFGVMNMLPSHPEQVRIRCTKEQGEYLKSFPLHHSQRVISETEDYIVFNLFLYTSYDLMQELLSYGSEITVLSPISFAHKISCTLKKAVENYVNTGQPC